MAKPGRITQDKRNRERAQRDRRLEKEADRAVRKEARKERALVREDGIDPDLIGIVPGPQPLRDE
jgi:hypothetical protein